MLPEAFAMLKKFESVYSLYLSIIILILTQKLRGMTEY